MTERKPLPAPAAPRTPEAESSAPGIGDKKVIIRPMYSQHPPKPELSDTHKRKGIVNITRIVGVDPGVRTMAIAVVDLAIINPAVCGLLWHNAYLFKLYKQHNISDEFQRVAHHARQTITSLSPDHIALERQRCTHKSRGYDLNEVFRETIQGLGLKHRMMRQYGLVQSIPLAVSYVGTSNKEKVCDAVTTLIQRDIGVIHSDVIDALGTAFDYYFCHIRQSQSRTSATNPNYVA